MLEVPPTPCLEVGGLGHGERRREARKEVAVVLAIGHTLRAHEALGRPDALPGFLEVVHRLFEDGVFVSHGQKYTDKRIIRSPDCFAFTRERLRPPAFVSGWVFVGYIDEYGEEMEASYHCRRCADSR